MSTDKKCQGIDRRGRKPCTLLGMTSVEVRRGKQAPRSLIRRLPEVETVKNRKNITWECFA